MSIQNFKNVKKTFQDTGKYVFGVQDTLHALEMGAVETLICWENLDITRYKLKRANGEEKIVHLRPDQEKDRTHFVDQEVSVYSLFNISFLDRS